MARNNVFKLSGNMALGSNDPYSANDFDNIKSSLKLLKSRQPQRQQQEPDYYGGSYSSNVPSRQVPTKHPSNDYQNYNYQQSNNRGGSYKDVYQQMEQHYPKNDYKPSKLSRDYEYQERNDYAKQRQQPRAEQYNSRAQQPNQRAQQPQRQQYRQQDNYRQQDYRQQDNYKQQDRRQARGNTYQERNIKEINRENRVEIKEYDPSELIECSEGCGRKFNPDSISKHQNVCRQVFQKKRKAFNAQEQRIIANEQKKLIKKGEAIDRKLEQRKAKEKVPKWKAQSLQLRAGLSQARNGSYKPSRQEQEMLKAVQRSQFTKCQYCGRSFNQQAAKKHIPFCQAQQKKNQMKRR